MPNRLHASIPVFLVAIALVPSLMTTIASAASSVASRITEPTSTRPSPESISTAARLLLPASGWSLGKDEKVEFDSNLWALVALADGSEVYSLKSGGEQKRVVLRDGPHLSTVSAYKLGAIADETRRKLKGAGKDAKGEDATSVAFHKGRLYALTRCKDDGGPSGRTCLTASERSCHYVHSPEKEFPTDLSQELKTLEVRAVATVLTLRGPDHQLENVSRFGNRMGLKDPLQTTKGRLTAKDGTVRTQTLNEMTTLCQEAGFNPNPNPSNPSAE